jgi:c-di-GMP-binding flagellar brake protein YcgR
MFQIELCLIVILMIILGVYWREERRWRRNRIPVARVQYFWNGVERRDHERINFVFNARYQVVEEASDLSLSQHEGLTDNLSFTGLKLIVYERLKIGEKVEMEIEIPLRETLKCKGIVIWVKDLAPEERGREEREKRSFVVGLQFTELSPVIAERLSSFANEGAPNITASAT